MSDPVPASVEAPPSTSTPPASAEDAAPEEFTLADFTGMKKKKRAKPKPAATAEEDKAEEAATPAPSAEPSAFAGEVGVLAAGDPSRDYHYAELLERVFALLHEKNPNLSVRKRHVMPPPQLVRVGTRKTMWSNFNQICQLMHRQPEHVQQFFLAEMGTDGSIDGNVRLVIKGRFQPKQVESLLKKYIVEYVSCHMCRNPETTLTRDPVTRLYFLQCESCGSRRSVAPIKTGFHATNRVDRRKVKAEAK